MIGTVWPPILGVFSALSALSFAFVGVDIVRRVDMSVLAMCSISPSLRRSLRGLPYRTPAFIGSILSVVFDRPKPKMMRIDAQSDVARMAYACAVWSGMELRNVSDKGPPRCSMGRRGLPPNLHFPVAVNRLAFRPEPAACGVDGNRGLDSRSDVLPVVAVNHHSHGVIIQRNAFGHGVNVDGPASFVVKDFRVQ